LIGSPDESIREVIWNDENKVICCPEHQNDFIGKPYVIKIESVRFPIECGFKTCSSLGIVEIELSKDGTIVKNAETVKNRSYEVLFA